MCLNTTHIPSETPRGTPQDISRQHKMPTDTNRHQQTPADTARLIKKHLAVSAGVCCRLLVSFAVYWCLLLCAGVLCCMEMSVGCLCGCPRVSEWYLWMTGFFRCVWELSERWVLAEWSQVCHSWTALKNKIFSTDYNETSKYQNVQISASQKSLGYAICLIC